jgi:hypothetical protein
VSTGGAMKFIQAEKGKYLNLSNLGSIELFKDHTDLWLIILYSFGGDAMTLCTLNSNHKGVEVNSDMADNVLRYLINSLHIFVEEKMHVILEKKHFQSLADQYLEVLTNKKDFDISNPKGFIHE